MRGTAFAPAVAGNTIEALRAAHSQQVRYIEIDLILTRAQRLITAHEPPLKPCGVVSRLTESQLRGCRLKGGLHVATLAQALAIPFDGVFLDLKDTKSTDDRGRQAVAEAVRVVSQHSRAEQAVLMVYSADDDLVAPIKQAGLRAGLKGYPESVEETRKYVDEAASKGMEMLCVNSDRVTPELIAYSAKKGVWHLPWSTKPNQARQWAELARAGAGGLIVLHYDVALTRAAPHWQRLPTVNIAM
jgi:glycerophosphoryl diester phosphodiesterase